MSKSSSTRQNSDSEIRGPVLEVLKDLLVGRRDDEVMALFSALVARNQELEQLMARMRESKNRGERVSSAQLDLFLERLREQQTAELAEANTKLEKTADDHGGRSEEPKPAKQPAVRRPPPPGLRRVENPIAVPSEERACPVCGHERKCVGHETTEVIDLIPAEVIVRLDRREVLACDPCDAEMVRAPLGDKVVAGGAYGSRLVGWLLVGKFWDGMPLNRLGQGLERLGLSMPSSSMADQIRWAAELLEPIWRHLMDRVLAASVMHIDGTGLPVRDRDGPEGIVTGTLWGYVGDEDAAFYLYTSTGKKRGQRPGELGPEEFLTRRRGYVCADAANLFDASFADGSRIEVGCNMHARRYWVKALEAGDVRAAVPIAAFKTLYDIEDRLKHADRLLRLLERRCHSKPVYDELLAWCETYQPTEPPKSLLGKAIQYQLNHREALSRFLDDGALPIDNGIVERMHRRPAVGRRNFLFAGSHDGADRAAIAYSVLSSCKLADVNPVDYLADVLPRLARGGLSARDIAALVPAEWKQARTAPLAVAE